MTGNILPYLYYTTIGRYCQYKFDDIVSYHVSNRKSARLPLKKSIKSDIRSTISKKY